MIYLHRQTWKSKFSADVYQVVMKNEEWGRSNRRRKIGLNTEEKGFHAAGRMNPFE